ncbi:HAD family hydrolase [Rubritalea marina]|uniref:HAD family hydrolase n=1 Tax=Rubritalea marina TaxID=361055 RepID=UPI00037DF627|nr:HAD family hydrolase [Rubritalea marina]
MPLFKNRIPRAVVALTGSILLGFCSVHANPILPSWADGAARANVLQFIDKVTDKSNADYVKPTDRVAVFDNDGTLWAEQPIYFQMMYAFDQVRARLDQNPEWKEKEPFRSALANDYEGVLKSGEKGILELVMATHAGMSTEEYAESVAQWIATAKHPSTGRMIKEMVYQPMLELLELMREEEFVTYIVSGGGVDFMRVFAEEVYGIPPEQVIGSRLEVEFTNEGGIPTLMRKAKIDFIDDKGGKPVGIHTHIGKRPIACFGNSDGDLAMMQWTHAGEGARFCMYIHHTDEKREWAYDHPSAIGHFEKGLNEAKEQQWTVVDMKRDWINIFPNKQKTTK